MKSIVHPAAMITASVPAQNPKASSVLFAGLCTAFGVFWLSCFAGTTDMANWYIENMLVVLFIIVLGVTYRRYRFSNVSYICFFIFLCLHVYGAKYAYADNPFGYRLQQHWHLRRNPYDRIVHTSFGLLMVYPIRELLTRTGAVKRSVSWWLPVEMVLSLAGLFELVEWSVADVFCPEHGKNYVGTQGDIWDAQKDMVVALGGAVFITCVMYAVKRAYGRKVKTSDVS